MPSFADAIGGSPAAHNPYRYAKVCHDIMWNIPSSSISTVVTTAHAKLDLNLPTSRSSSPSSETLSPYVRAEPTFGSASSRWRLVTVSTVGCLLWPTVTPIFKPTDFLYLCCSALICSCLKNSLLCRALIRIKQLRCCHLLYGFVRSRCNAMMMFPSGRFVPSCEVHIHTHKTQTPS